MDGCTGALASFQRERAMTYDEMKQAIAEATDGLPEDQPAD
ncbi:lipoprotein [Bordetella pertussis]|nr:lipoprotein [Bordetella pertussis]